jgi:hypothetical protein
MLAAPPARANSGSLETTTAIAMAATVRDNFREFFMSRALPGLKSGHSLEVNSLFLHPDITGTAII